MPIQVVCAPTHLYLPDMSTPLQFYLPQRPWLPSGFVQNATICCIQERIRITPDFFTPAETVTIPSWQRTLRCTVMSWSPILVRRLVLSRILVPTLRCLDPINFVLTVVTMSVFSSSPSKSVRTLRWFCFTSVWIVRRYLGHKCPEWGLEAGKR